MMFARVSILIAAVCFVGFGVWFLSDPSGAGATVEIVVGTPTARTDFRATYGGFNIGIGVFLLLCALQKEWLRPGLWAQICIFLGYAMGRGFGLLTDAEPVRMMYWLFATELSGAALGLAALRNLGRE
ncbi:MAG: DUF4345 domain-containing protein [Bryobacteraceae bacterium]